MRLLEGGTATKSAGGQASPVQSPCSPTHCFAPLLPGPLGRFRACPARTHWHTRRGGGAAGRPDPPPTAPSVRCGGPREEARMRERGGGVPNGPPAGGGAVRGGLVLG